MDTDDRTPRPAPTGPDVRFADLARLSVAELRDYRGALETEIVRVDEAIRAKQASLDAAAAFFKA